MSWKSFIKSLIPPIPFFPSTRRQILGLTRTAFKPTRLDTDHYLFREAEFEKDCDDIVATYPSDGPGFAAQEQRSKEFVRRFQKRIPCFIVRDKETDQLLGAVWMSTEEYRFFAHVHKHSAKTIFKVVTLFLNSEKRGKGLGKQLLSFAIERIFATTDSEFVLSAVLEVERRLPSLLLHLSMGFSVLGTHSEQNILGVYLPRFVRKNTHPFFNDFPKTPVVVLAWDGSVSLGVARSLGRHGVPVYALSHAPRPSLARSRYVKKNFSVPSLENKEEVRNRLEDILREIGPQTSKTIFMATHELQYSDLEPLTDFLNEYFNVLTPFEKTIPLVSKNDQFPLATQAGFRVMATMMLRNINDLEHVEESLVFPVVVRATSQFAREKLVLKMAFYENFEAMQKHLRPMLSIEGVELIAQEYIHGSDGDVLVFMASCDGFGEPRLWLAGRKIRQCPPGGGFMAAGQIDSIPDPDFVEKSKELCRLFGLRGNIGIECKQHAVTKEYCYIESSFRPEAFNAMGLVAGVDLIWDSYLVAVGKPCGAVRPEEPKGAFRNGEWEHATMKILRKQGAPGWWKVFIPLPRPVAYAFFAWDDPLPFFHSVGTLLMRKISKLFMRK